MSRSSPPVFPDPVPPHGIPGTPNEPLPGSGMNIRFALPATRLARLLAGGLALLLVMHMIGVFCHLVLHKKAEAFVTLFDMDLEANLPTFYNCFLFFVCGGLFLFQARLPGQTQRYGWLVMTGAMLFLGVDEGSQIHEKFMLVTLRLMNHGQQAGGDMGWLYYAWVIPYGAAAALLVMVLTRWLISLAPELRWWLMVGGAVYLTGAVFMEMYSGKLALGVDPSGLTAEQLEYIPCEIYPVNCCHQYLSLPYIAAYTLEETMEMTGLIITAYALMKGLGAQRTTIEIATAPIIRK